MPNVFESCRLVFLEIYDEQPQTEFSALLVNSQSCVVLTMILF